MSLVPPTLRQSRKTVRPVFALYQSWDATVSSCRIASWWGEMRTGVSAAWAAEALWGRRMNGRATVATRARMIIPRLSMGRPLVGENDDVRRLDARKEFLGSRSVHKPRVKLE